jgi:hypothetical protein
MSLTAGGYLRAWEGSGTDSPSLNRRLVAGSCVLEALSMVAHPEMRYVFVDDFGYAVSYCRDWVRDDLVPPDERKSGDSMEQWLRIRSAFALSDLAAAWEKANAAFSQTLDAFISEGYSPTLGDQLRETVNTYGLDLELGEIFILPQDIHALLTYIGNPLVWWDEEAGQPEGARFAFNFANPQHREALTRRLRAANGAI